MLGVKGIMGKKNYGVFFYFFSLSLSLSVRSEPDMFSFLKSQWRPDPPEPDLEALDMAVIQAECQGTSNT